MKSGTNLRRTNKMNGNIQIVIGSWGSYNECNERALGSEWLDLSEFYDWDEIVDELKKEGFELDGVQPYELQI